MNRFARFTILFAFSLLLIISPAQVFSDNQQEMNVHFIDVGQGDSILIETPSNKVILIDGGPPEAGKKVVQYVNDLQIKKIDLVIATHPDIDHIGGLIEIMKSVKVDHLIDSGKFHTTKTYEKYIHQIQKQQIPIEVVKQNERIVIDPRISIDVLNTHNGVKNNNESSIVLKITFDEISFLLMGDVEQGQEIDLLATKNLNANIIKVAHHGSKTSSSLSFLKKVRPEIALITYSKNNKFGHPVNRVIQNLNRINSDIYSTAVFGDVVIRTNGKSYFILLDKSPVDGLLDQSG